MLATASADPVETFRRVTDRKVCDERLQALQRQVPPRERKDRIVTGQRPERRHQVTDCPPAAAPGRAAE